MDLSDPSTSTAQSHGHESESRTRPFHALLDQEQPQEPAVTPMPLCSVLATVIDYVMMDPTPLEPREFHQQYQTKEEGPVAEQPRSVRVKDSIIAAPQDTPAINPDHNKTKSIQVPVIRVFGPIIRRRLASAADGADESSQTFPAAVLQPPRQSACLYIHGAFPYMLARPVVAGPDGGPARFAISKSRRLKYTDWDCPDAVAKILPILRDELEASLQASVSSVKGNDNSKLNIQYNHTRFIRQLSVVVGRGFYTYCLGPAAPFVRVEYFNPAQRWRIKLALENGLGEVPRNCYPDPKQYSYNLDKEGFHAGNVDHFTKEDDDAYSLDTPQGLQFHCYEAHIPYSMQFFKDYNLSGMSYIHLEQALFRRALPLRALMSHCHLKSDQVEAKQLFLRTNTDQVWPLGPNSCTENGTTADTYDGSEENEHDMPDLHQPTPPDDPVDNSASSQQDFLSYSAQFDLMEDEKLKMDLSGINCPGGEWSKSLTSCQVELDTTVAHILNVVDVITGERNGEGAKVCWRAVPSLETIWSQERRRMKRLLRPHDDFLSQPELKQPTPPPPLTLNVSSDTGQSGTHLACEGMRRLAQVTGGLYEAHRRAAGEIVERHKQTIQSIDTGTVLEETTYSTHEDGVTSARADNSAQMESISPADEDAIAALEGLGLSQGWSSAYCRNAECNMPGVDNAMQDVRTSPRDDGLYLEDQSMTQKSQSLQSMTSNDLRSQFVLTQRIDRGDGIIDGPLDFVDDYINPETLRPFEEIDEDISLSDESMEEVVEPTELKPQMTEVNEVREPVVKNSLLIESPNAGLKEEEIEIMSSKPLCDIADTNMVESTNFRTILPSYRPQESPLEEISHLSRTLRSNHPPSRADFQQWSMMSLLPMEGKDSLPSWLLYAASYFKNFTSVMTTPLLGSELCLVRTCPPPHRRFVRYWLQRTHLKPQIDGSSASAIVERKLRRAPLEAVETVNDPNLEEGQYLSDQQASHLFQLEDCLPCEAQGLKRKADASDLLTSPPEIRSIDTSTDERVLKGMGAQGGKLYVEGGGKLKHNNHLSQGDCYLDRKHEFSTPVSVMVVEIHVQCRKGKDSTSRPIALTPQPDRDRVSAIVFVFGVDPGGGEEFQVLERACLLIPTSRELESVQSDDCEENFLSSLKTNLTSSIPEETIGRSSSISVECFLNERQLILRFASLVRWKDPDMLCSWDTQGAGLGFLIERSMIVQNGASEGGQQGGIDLAKLLSRTPTVSTMSEVGEWNDQYQAKELRNERRNRWKGSGMGADWDERVGAGVAASSIVGRLTFASWKLIAEEVKHSNASYLQAVVFSVTGKRIPFHDNYMLTGWYSDDKGKNRWRVLHYRLVQAMSTILLFDALDVIGRAGEAARLSGVELSHSFPGIRGSQYKVEGVLLRALQSLSSEERGNKVGLASSRNEQFSFSGTSVSQSMSPWKRRRTVALQQRNLEDCQRLQANRMYFFYSPSLHATDLQEALQVQALTLEPKSGHYDDPVVVCDFTALYPSLIIAYNLCYSTIGGHLEYQSTREEMRIEGRTTQKIGPFAYDEGRTAMVLHHHLRSASSNKSDRAYIAPTGDVYVAESVVKGVLPRILEEMLTTSAMLKKAATLYKRNVKGLPASVMRQLEARQLALKYVANVTYGYTSATFSGRCAIPLLADTIVECGRRTLSNAIDLANTWGKDTDGRWRGCTVIYGDTDSIFVRLPGRSVQEAFCFGEDFCDAVTRSNPPPIKLKLEKVYLGSIMQTKKKYCGMKYESADQTRPEFEAKGIETVRRDQCALTQKILTNVLKRLFLRGIASAKDYLSRQWRLIESGKFPVSEFILTGRVRTKYRASLPVQAVLARRMTENDPGLVVRHKERLAYVIVASPGRVTRLSDAVITPLELLEHWDMYTLNTSYYITKHVNAAVQRCLGLEPHNVNIQEWYKFAPKARSRIHFWPTTGKGVMISSFFGSDRCWFCARKSKMIGRTYVSICEQCRMNESHMIELASRLLNKNQKKMQALAQLCTKCSLYLEGPETYATVAKIPSKTGKVKVTLQSPIANCSCIDCPVTYQRHHSREADLELSAVFEALNIKSN